MSSSENFQTTCFQTSCLRIKIQGLDSVMHKATQNFGSKHAYDLSKFLKWMQNVSFAAVVSFVSFEASVQRCSFK